MEKEVYFESESDIENVRFLNFSRIVFEGMMRLNFRGSKLEKLDGVVVELDT